MDFALTSFLKQMYWIEKNTKQTWNYIQDKKLIKHAPKEIKYLMRKRKPWHNFIFAHVTQLSQLKSLLHLNTRPY